MFFFKFSVYHFAMAFKRYLILKYILIIKAVAKVQNILESLSSVKRINMQVCFHSTMYNMHFYNTIVFIFIPKCHAFQYLNNDTTFMKMYHLSIGNQIFLSEYKIKSRHY